MSTYCPGGNTHDHIHQFADEDDCCPCGTCIETIGYDPEVPCPHCPRHGGARR